MRTSVKQRLALAFGIGLGATFAGCQWYGKPEACNVANPCNGQFQQIEYPDVCRNDCDIPVDGDHLRTGAPITISNWQQQPAREMSLEECIELALANNKVLQKLGGRVLNSPQAAATSYDPALIESNPLRSSEAALSAFDAQFQGISRLNYSERKFNNRFFGQGADSLSSYNGNLFAGLSKYAANGSQFRVFSNSDYNRNDSPANTLPSSWDTVLQAEVRQPLARGAGSQITRIAGPNPVAGSYNGVLIARIQGDVALVDFETAVRDLTREVEQAYWELYYSYRDLDVKSRAREAALSTWEYRKRRLDAGLSRPDDEALARQQFWQFEQQVVNALGGTGVGQRGVLGAERELRRLLGLINNDGTLIRPSTDPTIAPVIFDWEQAQEMALCQRTELRRQKWIIRQRELELLAARKLNKWQVDALGSYAARGFGDNLLGSRSRPEGSAFADMFTGELDEWGVGLEVAGPVGNRRGHLAIRNAELSLIREKALLEEQQKQLLHDLNAAWIEVDRSSIAIRNAYNSRAAAEAELEPKRIRAEKGEEDVFFLLDALQRSANSETAFHRAVVDYNLALQNFVFTSGGLLAHYNICLIEDEWTAMAQEDSLEKDRRYRYGVPNRTQMDVCPITTGPVDQSTDLVIYGDSSSATTGPAPATPPGTEDGPAATSESDSSSPSDLPAGNGGEGGAS
jgi:outer membrane protein TolC